jgi:adenylate cyclase
MDRALGSAPGIALAAAVVALALAAALRHWGVLQPPELAAYDTLLRLRAEPPAPQPRVVQVGVTEDDIVRFGWPLSDAILARLVAVLDTGKARAIGIDVYRPYPVPPGSAELDAALRATPSVVWTTRFGDGSWTGIPAPAALEGSARTGFSDLVPDEGGIVRRGLLYLDDGKVTETAFAARLAFLYLARQGIAPRPDPSDRDLLRLGGVTLRPLAPDTGAYAGADARGYQILIEFRHGGMLRTLSLGDLLDGKAPAGFFADRIVVVGVTSDSVKDFVETPLDTEFGADRSSFGVTLHGVVAAQLLEHALDGLVPTTALPGAAELALIALWTLAGAALGAWLRAPLALLGALAAGLLATAAFAYAGFLWGWWLPAVPAALGWSAAAGLASLLTYREERAQRRALMRLFSIHVSPAIAAEMWRRRGEFASAGRPLPTRLTATVLFSDIVGFTAIAERLAPETLERWLNRYMGAMTERLSAAGGVIEKFAGDGITAMFGVPVPRKREEQIAADAQAAARCALALADALARVNAGYREAGLPEVRMGIGISTGELIAGSVGSADRLQYAVIGDPANTAARLVDVAKEALGAEPRAACRIVVSDATRRLLGDVFRLEALGELPVKGKAQRVGCHLLLEKTL